MTSSRYKKAVALKKAGFLPFEIREMLSTTRTLPSGKVIKVKSPNLSSPFLKGIIRERAKRAKGFRKSRKEHRELTPAQFSRQYRNSVIEELYVSNNWFNEDGNPDFWQLLRKAEDDYRNKHPEYPDKKHRKAKGIITPYDLDEQRIRYRKSRARSKPVGEVVFNEKTGKFEPRFYA